MHEDFDFITDDDIFDIGADERAIIPHGTTLICAGAFEGYESLQCVTIPSSVTEIGAYAFCECENLKSVVIPVGLKRIGEGAFWDCKSLESLTFSDSTQTDSDTRMDYINLEIGAFSAGGSLIEKDCHIAGINIEVFSGCPNFKYINIPCDMDSFHDYTRGFCKIIKAITLPDTVTEIGFRQFENWPELESVTISDSVSDISPLALSGCEKLKRIVVDEKNRHYSNDEYGALFSKNKTMLLKYSPHSAPESYAIPNTVTEIAEFAFEDCTHLKTISISNGKTKLNDGAFRDCESLESVILPDGITEISVRAFLDCCNLKSINIPDSVTEIGTEAFCGCEKLESIIIPNGVTKIGECAFYECTGLTSINIPDSVTSLGGDAFWGCENLVTATIPESVTEIGEDAFGACDKLTVTVRSGSYAEEYCKKRNIKYIAA